MDLNTVWFGLLGVLMIAYAVLEGFDLGVGIVHLFGRSDEERRTFMNAIGPVWDGNEVWLVTFGGALFAAFPVAYAAVFSVFYTPFMMLLCALIFRAAAMEFRSKRPSRAWRAVWDTLFSVSSLVAALLFGVATGNAVRGLAINERMVYQGAFLDFLNPYSLLTGLMVVAMFATHGVLYLRLKTEGDLNARLAQGSRYCAGGFAALYIIVTLYTLIAIPDARSVLSLGILAPLNVLALLGLFAAIHRNRPWLAFLASAASIVCLCLIFASVLFPNLVISSLSPEYNLDIYKAASSPKTLKIMLTIVLLALPPVLAYTAWVYWVFRGKVKIGKFSY